VFRDNKSLVDHLRRYGYVRSDKVYRAMLLVDRREFVPEDEREYAYADEPLPIGYGQTISAPHMVAIMLELLDVDEGMNVLEIGTGSGYNAAILSVLVGGDGRVVTVERIKQLYEKAKKILSKYKNIVCVLGDGSMGCEIYAPYDRIIVTCGAPNIPKPLLEQLKEGGRMVIPVGGRYFQSLWVVDKKDGKIKKRYEGEVLFVPLIGEYGYRD